MVSGKNTAIIVSVEATTERVRVLHMLAGTGDEFAAFQQDVYKRQAHIIQPNCLNSTPDIPVTMVSGKNTAIIVSVEATTEIATSFAVSYTHLNIGQTLAKHAHQFFHLPVVQYGVITPVVALVRSERENDKVGMQRLSLIHISL